MLLFSHWVMCSSFRPHWLQHARPPCPSLSPRVCSNSCLLSQWCHQTILPSVTHFSSCPVFPTFRVFSNELALRIRWPKYWSFSFSINPSNEYSGLISFRNYWLNLPSVQGTLKSLLQYLSSKASILWHSAFFMVQFSHLTWLKWKGESCVLHSHKIAWERAMILLSVRKQAGAKFLWPRLRGLLDLWREGYQHRRGAEDSHTSELYWAESWHSSRTCRRRMLLRRKALPTTRRGKWCPLKKKPFVLFANLSPPGLKLKGVGEKMLSLKHDLRAKWRALHRMLTVPSMLDLGRLVNWAESHVVMESDWTVVKRSERAGVKTRQWTVEGSGGKIKTPPCSVHSKVLTVPDTGRKHINDPHPSSQKPWCFNLWWPPAEGISVYSCNFN